MSHLVGWETLDSHLYVNAIGSIGARDAQRAATQFGVELSVGAISLEFQLGTRRALRPARSAYFKTTLDQSRRPALRMATGLAMIA